MLLAASHWPQTANPMNQGVTCAIGNIIAKHGEKTATKQTVVRPLCVHFGWGTHSFVSHDDDALSNFLVT